MAAQKARTILIKRYNGSSYVTVGGLRSKSIRINGAAPADVSDSESTWRELLAGAGLKSVSISGNGVFKDSTSENAVLADILADTETSYQFVVGGLGTFQGSFIATSMEFSGGHEGEAGYAMSWESNGQVSFS